MSQTTAAITYSKKDKKSEKKGAPKDQWLLDRSFQIVLGLHRSRSQILEYFDLAPTKALARFEINELVVEALPTFVESLRSMSFFLDPVYWSPATVGRVTKYVAKGFECAVPGVRRDAFKTKVSRKRQIGVDDYLGDKFESKGISMLFEAESEVLGSRNFAGKEEYDFVDKVTGRLIPAEAAVIQPLRASSAPPTPPACLSGGYNDADLYDPYSHLTDCGATTGSYGYIKEPFRKQIAVRLGDARRGQAMSSTFFTFSNAGRFDPSDALLGDLHDPESLEKIAVMETSLRSSAADDDEDEYDNEAEEEMVALRLQSDSRGAQRGRRHGRQRR